MKKAFLLAVVALFGLVATGYAQQNAAWNLLESPFKLEAEVANVGETVTCTVGLGGGTASLFGLDKVPSTSPVEFYGGELGGSWRIFHFDELCANIATWGTSFTGPTMTGVTADLGGTVYWAVDPFGTGTIDDYLIGTGMPGPGTAVPLAAGFPGVWGPIDINTNEATLLKAFCEDIAADLALEYHLGTGAIGGSIPNPDNGAGTGAYGNGISDAVDPSLCSGAGMVMSSGTITDAQVTRASQVDSLGTLCYSTWDLATPTLPFGETFVNGIQEFSSTVTLDRRMMALGNVTGIAFNIGRPVGITDCQGQDSPDSDVAYVNSSQGGLSYTVAIDNTAPLGMAMQKPPAGGNGKYVNHLNSGIPSAGTVSGLPAGLGTFCFPLLIPPFGSAAPVCVWNNIGKTERVGASNYFGTPIADPTKAPAFFVSDADGDAVNFPLGSQWTLQGIVINPAGSSPKAASVTNGLVIDVTAGI